jgi:flagellar biosynthesis protein FliQ
MAPEARLCCTPGWVGAPDVVGMTDTQIVELALQGMTIAAKMCAPILLTALLIGFAISLFQSVTQIQEATLSFVPKAAGVGAALLFSGNWMLHEMVTYTTQLFERIPSLLS